MIEGNITRFLVFILTPTLIMVVFIVVMFSLMITLEIVVLGETRVEGVGLKRAGRKVVGNALSLGCLLHGFLLFKNGIFHTVILGILLAEKL